MVEQPVLLGRLEVERLLLLNRQGLDGLAVDEALPEDKFVREFAPVLQGLRRELDLQEVGHLDCDVHGPAVLGLELETDLAQV